LELNNKNTANGFMMPGEMLKCGIKSFKSKTLKILLEDINAPKK
jgi:hypothetical protein